jgi:flagellar hook-associated protein FlgK
MRASFFEFNIAMTGLFTARQNLNVVAHNLANAAIPGYSRQYTLQRAARPLSLNNSKGMYGTGSEVIGIAQIRDMYLDRKFWHQRSIKGEYDSKNVHLALMETIFSELNDSNVLACFQSFFKRLHDLSGNAPDATYRTNVISAAETLANMVRSNSEALLKQQMDVNREIADTVSIINSLGNQIATINRQIHQFEMDGSNANDLRDQRALLVDRLSELVNVEVMEYDYGSEDVKFNKRYSVMINGYDFVSHDRYQPLMVVPRESSGFTANGSHIASTPKPKRNIMDAPGLYDIFFANSGAEFNIYSNGLKGSLKGLIDIRDGNNTINTMSSFVPGTLGTPGNYTPGVGPQAVQIFSNAIDDTSGNGFNARINALLTQFASLPSGASLADIQRISSNLFNEIAGANLPVRHIEQITNKIVADGRIDTGSSEYADYMAAINNYKSLINDVVDSINHVLAATDADEALARLTAAVADINSLVASQKDVADTSAALLALDTDTRPSAPSTVVIHPKRHIMPAPHTHMVSTTTYKGIPFYMNKLNTLVRTFARAINEGLNVDGQPIPGVIGHIFGYDYHGNNKGMLMFTFTATMDQAHKGTGHYLDFPPLLDDLGNPIPYNPPRTDESGNIMYQLDYSRLNALNFTINPQLTREPYLLACSSDPTIGESHNDVILGFQKISTYPSLFKEGRLLDFIIGTSDHMSIDRRQAKNFALNYNEIVMQTDNQRLSVSGVDINEEMVDMVKYQQLFQAAARLINVINNIYDTMINRLGAF